MSYFNDCGFNRSQIEEAFTDLDALLLADARNWVYATVEKIEAIENQGAFGGTEFSDACGGKSAWQNIFMNKTLGQSLDIVEKQVKKKIENRNNAIIKKLKNTNINYIPNFKVVKKMNDDGFSGTADGVFETLHHKIMIHTILAGGEKQRLHQRTLVNITDI
jgi:hypothetical protein